jgi:hypothetical protein
VSHSSSFLSHTLFLGSHCLTLRLSVTSRLHSDLPSATRWALPLLSELTA